MTPIERAVAAAIAELRHQGDVTAWPDKVHGTLVSIDGGFAIKPIVHAVIAAIRAPSPKCCRPSS